MYVDNYIYCVKLNFVNVYFDCMMYTLVYASFSSGSRFSLFEYVLSITLCRD